MSRLLRWAFNSAAALSAVLFVATCVLWARSYRGSDYLERRRMTHADAMSVTCDSISLACTHGEVRFITGEDVLYLPAKETTPRESNEDASWSMGRLGVNHYGWETPKAQTVLSRLGFAAWQDGFTSSFADARNQVWAGPAWLVALLWAILPVLWARRAFRSLRRYRRGLCRVCGYDLRATVDRCPECGAVPEMKPVW